jgi:hypothetical protein
VEIVIGRRFRGPLNSANGGYCSGRLAALTHASEVEVTLRLPPPLDTPLAVSHEAEVTRLRDGDHVIAEARPAPVRIDVPAAVTVAQADEGSARHVRAVSPIFSECFVCGVRADGDGLGIYAGPVLGREPLHAAPWIVRESALELVWAAIDCPGAYAVGAAGRGEVVLGRMSARVDRVPEVGETCVAVAWPLGEEGRKLFAGTALFAADGEVLAHAHQVWILPRAAPTPTAV